MSGDKDSLMVSHLLGPEIRIQKETPFALQRCRCGRRLLAGDERFVISNPPPSVKPLLANLAFCTVECVRAYLLETLADSESLAGRTSDQTVADLRETYLDLSRVFDDLRFDLSNPFR